MTTIPVGPLSQRTESGNLSSGLGDIEQVKSLFWLSFVKSMSSSAKWRGWRSNIAFQLKVLWFCVRIYSVVCLNPCVMNCVVRFHCIYELRFQKSTFHIWILYKSVLIFPLKVFPFHRLFCSKILSCCKVSKTASSVIGLIYILAFTWKVMWTSPKSDLEGAVI